MYVGRGDFTHRCRPYTCMSAEMTIPTIYTYVGGGDYMHKCWPCIHLCQWRWLYTYILTIYMYVSGDDNTHANHVLVCPLVLMPCVLLSSWLLWGHLVPVWCLNMKPHCSLQTQSCWRPSMGSTFLRRKRFSLWFSNISLCLTGRPEFNMSVLHLYFCNNTVLSFTCEMSVMF